MIAESPDLNRAVTSPLDRALEIRGVSPLAVGWLIVIAGTIALHLSRLTQWGLGPTEARDAYGAWLLYQGKPEPSWAIIPHVGPLPLLLEGISYFLFGVTDATFRLPGALAGILIVLAPLMLRRAVGEWKALGMGVLLAVSPTLLYAARTESRQIIAAALTLLLVVGIARIGSGVASMARTRRWAVIGGVTLGALLATGPEAVTLLICLGLAVVFSSLLAPAGVVRICFARLQGERATILGLLAALILSVLVLFSRFFSDPAALAGVPATFGDWFALLVRGSGSTPTPVYFLLMLLMYEPVALLLAISGHFLDTATRQERSMAYLFAGWGLFALLLWSFSAGRGPEHAVQVALPFVLLGGIGLGSLLASINWTHFWRGRGGLLALCVLGAFVALVAVDILLGRASGVNGLQTGGLPAALVTMLALVPFIYGCWQFASTDRADGFAGQPARVVLLVFVLLLGMYAVRSTILLSFQRGAQGTEPLAGEVASEGLLASVQRLNRLARDTSVTEGSVRDVTGSFGLRVALDEQSVWPWQWYLRDYPEVAVAPAAELAGAAADVRISPDREAAIAGGYTGVPALALIERQNAWDNPDPGAIFRGLLPDRWLAGWRFLLFRENAVANPSEQTLGFSPELAARFAPESGPYTLDDRAGPGSAGGQFNQPIGIATDPDGTILVVDSGNGRVERFGAAGEFLGAWGGGERGIDLARTANGLGPTGITTDADDNAFIADTWNHRVLALDAAGRQLFVLGDAAAAAPDLERQPADTGDDPARVGDSPGLFFGPRAVAVSDDAIFVSDTGNERVQKFDRSGNFELAFGGYGSEPGRLIEPVGIALGPDGNLYVADSGNARIAVFSPDGAPVRQFPVSAWPPPDPTGARPAFQPYLLFTAEGLLLASSSQSGSVEVYDPNGAFVSSLTELSGSAFQNPVGLALGAENELLVTDMGQNAVLRGPLPVFPAPLPLPGASPVASPLAATPAG